MPSRLKYLFLGIFVFLFFFLLAFFGGLFWYVHQFDQAAGINFADVRQLIEQTRLEKLTDFNFLFLGLDTRPGSNTMLTDTIMVGSFCPREAKLTFLSIPRDLWIDPLKTKVNALYFYGRERDANDGTSLVKREIQKITGEDINYSIILNFDLVSEVVDSVGGIEINVDEAFDDYQYPRGDGSYGTMHIHFDRGWQLMDGARVLQYIRSRKSANPDEGNDEARVKRQQKVARAVFRTIISRRVIANPRITGKLYRLWRDKVDTDLPLSLLLKAGLSSRERGAIKLRFFSIPSSLLIHPPLRKHANLWVWEPKGGDWGEIREWIGDKM